ncbi:MAG: class I SAM-dependent methyltransferase [Clostridia bacterium]|nr:class I SAM-dependent methyltransferase [Clostridia bacterium]
MNAVNKTLYIPLYGKSYVSKKGLFLADPKAEEIWESEGFPLKRKAKSKYLAYYMGIRSAVFDQWLTRQMEAMPEAAVIHIGCGMDSRILRVGAGDHTWYDVDFPEVIAARERYYAETANYRMVPGDARDRTWLTAVEDCTSAIVVMEGVSMYLTDGEMRALTDALCERFERIALLVDCYTTFAARMSGRRNPVGSVGVTRVYGIDDPNVYNSGELAFAKEHAMTPREFIDELKGLERFVFSKLYAGGFSKKLYRLFEYRKNIKKEIK